MLLAAGAHSTWFHLYRLVLEQPPDMHATAEEGLQQERVQRVALAVEQFLQTSTVGEYEQRLSMVWSFRFALSSLKDSTCDPTPDFNTRCQYQFSHGGMQQFLLDISTGGYFSEQQ